MPDHDPYQHEWQREMDSNKQDWTPEEILGDKFVQERKKAIDHLKAIGEYFAEHGEDLQIPNPQYEVYTDSQFNELLDPEDQVEFPQSYELGAIEDLPTRQIIKSALKRFVTFVQLPVIQDGFQSDLDSRRRFRETLWQPEILEKLAANGGPSSTDEVDESLRNKRKMSGLTKVLFALPILHEQILTYVDSLDPEQQAIAQPYTARLEAASEAAGELSQQVAEFEHLDDDETKTEEEKDYLKMRAVIDTRKLAAEGLNSVADLLHALARPEDNDNRNQMPNRPRNIH